MKLEELKKTWNNQQDKEPKSLTEEEIMTLLDKKIKRYDTKITNRDRLEISVAVLMSIGSLIFFFFTDSVWNQIGCITIFLSCILIIYKLMTAKKVKNPLNTNPDVSMQQHLMVELQKVQNQKKLLSSMLWWYLLPLFVGIVFFVIGMDISVVVKLCVIGGNTVLYAYIWKMNQDAVLENIMPLIEDIEQSLSFLNSEQN